MGDNPSRCLLGLSQLRWAEHTLGIIGCFVCGGALDVKALSVYGRSGNLNLSMAPGGVVSHFPSMMHFPG